MNADDRVALEDVVIRYCSAIDTKDWELFRSCFTPGANATYGSRHYATLDILTDYMERLHEPLDASLHRITNVALTGDSPVRGRCYVAAVLVRRAHPEGPLLRAEGFYDDTFARTESGWAISQRTFTLLWETGSRNISGASTQP